MRKITAIFLINIIATIYCLQAEEVKIVLADKILLEQEEEILLNPRSFIIMEDGIIVIPDSKAGDFKIYDHNGKFKKIWGKQGPGPNEFGRPFFCNYKKPYFAFVDYGKRKIYVVKRVDDFSFKKVKEHLCLSLATDLKITKKSVLVAGYIIDSNYKEFALYMLQIDKKGVNHLLPIESSYGFTSKTKYKNSYNKIAALGNIGYCSINDKYIYYVWIDI